MLLLYQFFRLRYFIISFFRYHVITISRYNDNLNNER